MNKTREQKKRRAAKAVDDELKEIVIDTSQYKIKKSSTRILHDLRYSDR